MRTPVPNWNGIPREPAVNVVTTVIMTDEQRAWLDSIPRQSNPKPSKVWGKKEPLPPEPIKQEEPMEEKKQAREITFPHVNKEYIEAAFAAGKTAGQIEREAGMQQGTIYPRLKRWGIENQNQRKKPSDPAQTVKQEAKPVDCDYEIVNDLEERELIDLINHPTHYKIGGIETIDFIQAKLTPEEYTGFLKGVTLQYIIREKHKGGRDDLRKAHWYLSRLLDAE